MAVMTTAPEPSLSECAERAAAGDRLALEALLRRVRPLVVRTARLIVGSGLSAAEDAAQEALLDVARGISSLRDPQRVEAWALRIATSQALKTARRERWLRLVRQAAKVDIPTRDAPSETTVVLRSAFYELPPRARSVAVLRLYVGLSESETAEVLDCSTGTVKSQLHLARAKLQEILRAHDLAPSTMSKQNKGGTAAPRHHGAFHFRLTKRRSSMSACTFASISGTIADLRQRPIAMCADGYSSSFAAAVLRELGFAEATDVVGGFRAWRAAGLPVVHARAGHARPGELPGMGAPEPLTEGRE